MISFEVFEDVTYEITDTFPEVFFRELNGGVMVREYSRLHPAALDHDLFVLGEYHHDRYLGRFIVLYYGSNPFLKAVRTKIAQPLVSSTLFYFPKSFANKMT